MITSRVGCRTWSAEIREQGYRETRTVFFQAFYRAWFFFGVRVWSFDLFAEEVPIWAKAQLSCIGWTDWKSAAPQWMHDEANKNARPRGGGL
jgi:hypothetical protein